MGKYRIILLILLLGIVLYANMFRNSFLWDDELLIIRNEYIKDWSHLQEIFKINLFHSVSKKGNYYRPLQSLSLLFDYSLWRLNPFGYHLTNLLLHIFNAIIIYFLIGIISKSRKISLLTSLLFLVHPIQTQAVTYISGRADPLATLFFLLAFYFYIRSITLKELTPYLGSLLFFLLALLSKEIALIFPLVLLLYDRSFPKSAQSKTCLPTSKIRYLPFLAISGIYLSVRFFLLGSLLKPAITAKTSLYLRLLTMPRVIVSYLGLLFLPLNLHMERRPPLASSLSEPGVAISLILLILIGIFTLRMHKRSKVVFFSLAWFFLNLVPVSNILPLNAMMAEHWLYLPSLGFFLLASIGITKILETKKKKLIVVLVVSILAFYSFLTIRRNRDWKDGLTLYQNTLRYSPDSGKAHNNLGFIYFKEGKYNRAKEEFERAVESEPDLAIAYHNLGNVYVRKGEYNRAIEEYKKAIELNPDSTKPHYGLGVVYREKGELAEAIKEWKRTLEIMQDYKGIKLGKSEIEKAIEILLKKNEEK
jgi:hypothetical protein